MITVDPMLEYKILYDNQKTLCFVGSSFVNKTLFDYFSSTRPCELLRLEQIQNQDQAWYDARQFMTASADISLKVKIVESLRPYHPNYFTVIENRNKIGFNVQIGKGCYIGGFNVILDDIRIGDHTAITTFCTLSHLVTIGDFCHIGPQLYMLFCTLGSGSYVASKSSFVGKTQAHIVTADYCNYLIGSIVTKNIGQSGTYHSNRLQSKLTSLDQKID